MCGNGRREGTEECDNGDRNGELGSLCDAFCRQGGGSCGDGVVQPERGEECEPTFGSGGEDRYACSPSCRYILTRSSSQGSIPLIAGECGGDECARGGSEFCAVQDAVCVPDGRMPCLRCVPQVSSADSSTPVVGVAVSSLSGTTSSSDTVVSVTASSVSSRIVIVLNACGNGRMDPGEQCDNGPRNLWQPNAYCRPDCSLGRCGDGVVDTPLELCDLGSQNGMEGSTCTASCQIIRPSATVLPGTIIELPFTPAPQNPVDPFSPVFTSGSGTVLNPSLPPQTTASGPATLVIMAAGAAAGWAWMKKRRT